MKKGFYIPLRPEEYFKIKELSRRECGKLFIAFWEFCLAGRPPRYQLPERVEEWFEKLQKRTVSSKNSKINAGVRACVDACEQVDTLRALADAADMQRASVPGGEAGGVSNYDIHSGNLELSTDLELCTTINNNNSDDKSSTTTTTVYNSACASKGVENFQHSEKNVENFSYDEVDQWTESVELDIMEYFAKRNFDSNAEDFIAYNKSRDWKGIGGEDVREDYARYADRWESEERRKRGKYDWKPPII